MRRRDFLGAFAGSAVSWPLAARAQQPGRMRRIGVLMNTSETDPESEKRATAFQQGLEICGWKAGHNLQLDYRWGMGDTERTRAAATQLVGQMPDVILANATTAARILQETTHTIPIVFVAVSEPVAQGLVESLAHPGGNITGFTNLEPTIGAKWLALLKEIAIPVKRVTVMFNPKTGPNAELFAKSVQSEAPKLSMEYSAASVYAPSEIEPTLKILGSEPGGALILPPDTFTTMHRTLIIGLTQRYRVPGISAFRPFAAEGGLVSYGIDVADQFGQAARYADLILRGKKPKDLPVQQPTKFELVINLKTAKALNLTVPPTLLATADEVIE
jgi:putative ABC transport system substrate-binding protein